MHIRAFAYSVLLVCVGITSAQAETLSYSSPAGVGRGVLVSAIRFDAAIDARSHQLLCPQIAGCGERWECLPTTEAGAVGVGVERLATGVREYPQLSNQSMTTALIRNLKGLGVETLATNAQSASLESYPLLLRMRVATLLLDAAEQKGGFAGTAFGLGALLSFVAEEHTERTSVAYIESELIDRRTMQILALLRSGGAYSVRASSNPTFAGTFIETNESRRERLLGAVQQALVQAAQDLQQELDYEP